MKALGYIYRMLLALLGLGLSGLSLNAFIDQSRVHQSGLWGSNPTPPNARLAIIALMLTLLGLAVTLFSTYGWKYLTTYTKALPCLAEIAGYCIFLSTLALK